MPDDPQWTDALAEDLRSNPVFEKHKLGEGEALVGVPPSLIKSHVEQQRLIGRDKIPVPPEEATDEDWNEVWSRLGRPEKPEEYELKPPEDLPEQVQVSDELIGEYKGEAYKLGILPKQAQGLLTWFLGANAKLIEDSDKQRDDFQKQTEANLRKEWGKAYDEKVKSSASTFLHFADQMGEEKAGELKALMDETGLGDHPLLVGFFAKIGELIGEDVITGKPRTSFALTPDQAEAEINKIYGNPDHPYHHPKHAEHKAAVERMNELTEMQIAAEG